MSARPKKIMIADDDQGILDAIEFMLEYKGYNVCCSSQNTLENVLTENPDLLLLDIWMSGEDGINICKALKASPVTKCIPVLMISASKDIENSALSAGADDFLAKPFQMDTLLEKIEVLLQ